MTNQQKLEAVRAKIIAACPEVMEPKFGCRADTIITYKCSPAMFNPESKDVKMEKKNRIIIRFEKRQLPTELSEISCFIFDDSEMVQIKDGDTKNLIKILGQPIGIDSILRAFKASKKDREYILTIDQVGGLSCHSVIDEMVGFEVWDLTKTLDQQEEPVINLLYNLLCND